MQVLIIDDNRADRNIMQYLLEPMAEVEKVENGQNMSEATLYLEKRLAQGEAACSEALLFFCDYDLKLDNGIDVINQLRHQFPDVFIYWVLMSGMPFERTFPAKYPFIDCFLEKEMDLDKYRSQLQEIVSRANGNLGAA